MTVFKTVVSIVLGAVVAPGMAPAVELNTAGKTDAELNKEMVIRCQHQMGEFGNEAISICIESEREARKLLADYPDQYADIVRRCYRVMQKAGWSMIKTCSDSDIAAREALNGYPESALEALDYCREKVGRYGHYEVKQCVDKRIVESRQAGDG